MYEGDIAGAGRSPLSIRGAARSPVHIARKQKRRVGVHVAGLVAHRGCEKGARGPLGPCPGGPWVFERL